MLDEVRSHLAQEQLDALFVTNKTNIFYLTGFRGSNGYVLLTKNHLYLFTDPRYLEKAEKNASDECRVLDMSGGFFHLLHATLARHRVESIGIEASDMTVSFFNQLNSLNGFKILPADGILTALRALKSKEELRLLRQSQKINEQVLKLFLTELKNGMTEVEASWKMLQIAYDLGASGMSFDTIIAFGAHSAMPHHEVSSKKKLKRGDMVLIDMGVMYGGYASDMTRTFFTKTPTKEQSHVYETVLEANKRGIEAIKPGVRVDEIDKAARKYIHDAGYEKRFGHATGHGIGLDVHEEPRVAKGVETPVQPSMVVTVEPGIYLPGKLGVRIEDMVEVTEKGRKVLTSFPKELISMKIQL